MSYDHEETSYFYEQTRQQLGLVDAEIGTRFAGVFEQAVERRSELGAVVIQPIDDTQPTGSDTEVVATCTIVRHEVVVMLPVNREYYQPFIDGVYEERLKDAKTHVATVKGNVEPEDMMNIIAGHELWHGYEALQLVQMYGAERGAQIFGEQFQAAVAGLPLGMATSAAMMSWQNTDYRRKLRQAGIDEQTFQALLASNVQAYNQLPSEAAADDFAYDIIQALYLSSTVSGLLAPVLEADKL